MPLRVGGEINPTRTSLSTEQTTIFAVLKYKPKKYKFMNKKQKAALLQANSGNATATANENQISLEISQIKEEQKDSKAFNDGLAEPKAHKPTTNVTPSLKVDLAKESRQTLKNDIKNVVNSFDHKMSVLLKACETPNGKKYMQLNNLKIEDITKKQILKTLTSLVVNGKNLHVRIVELKEDKSNMLTAELLAVKLAKLDENGILQNAVIETVEIKYSVLDSGYLFEQNELNQLILTKGKKVYTFSIVEQLPYSIIIDRLAKYRKIANVKAAKLVQNRTEERLKAEKAEKTAKEKAEKAEKAKLAALAKLSASDIEELLKQKQALESEKAA